MSIRFVLCCITVIVSISFHTQVAHAAVIEGSVELAKYAPRSPAVSQRYAGQAGAGKADTAPPHVAVAYLEGASITREQLRPPEEPIVLAQKGLQFAPGILPVMLGSKVRFPNNDDVFHNVFSYSPSKSFDLGRYARNEEAPVQHFDTPGLVKLFCEVHSHMRGTILVLETPHFVTSDAEGNFRLEGIPAGEYILKVWVNEKQTLQRSVVVKDEETLTVEFSD